MQFLSRVKITRIEERSEDAWFDLSLRQLRGGEVRFYRVKDFLTGEWLFKACSDKELGKVMVRALKCPSGRRFSQLEGNTMLFQKSVIEGLLYDVISLTYADEMDRLRRKVVNNIDEIPAMIRENFEVKSYEEATGKRAPGKNWVTLTKKEDEKAMITLFLLERAWSLSLVSPEEKLKTIEEKEMLEPKKRRVEMDTGHVWACPICGLEFHFIHLDVDQKRKHKLKRRRLPPTYPKAPESLSDLIQFL